jgi:hypothetical protein
MSYISICCHRVIRFTLLSTTLISVHNSHFLFAFVVIFFTKWTGRITCTAAREFAAKVQIIIDHINFHKFKMHRNKWRCSCIALGWMRKYLHISILMFYCISFITNKLSEFTMDFFYCRLWGQFGIQFYFISMFPLRAFWSLNMWDSVTNNLCNYVESFVMKFDSTNC